MLFNCLRSEPEVFDPVVFKAGINIITGERSGETRAGNKTNGVGKTLLINFIDFCLLCDFKPNRISRIPEDVLDADTDIILEMSSKGKRVVVRRNIQRHDSPTIYVDGVSNPFASLNDAKKYLLKCILGDNFDCSFRQLMRAFKRTENLGYNDIDNPDGTVRDITPYLYIFGLSVELYQTILDKAQALIDAHKYDAELVKDIERLNISVKEAGAYVNDLKSQLEAIDSAVENLSQEEVYSTISDDIAELDEQLEAASLSLLSIKEEIKQIEKVPEYQDIAHDDILAVYNDCKKGLGDLIAREIDEIQEFKKIIDSFKTEVLTQRKRTLLSAQERLIQEIKTLSEEYRRKTSVLDKTGNLRSLKVSLHEQQMKRQDYNKVTFLYEQHLQQETRKLSLAAERGNALVEFEIDKEKNENVLREFQDEVLEIHEYLYGNRKASFEIEVKEAKRYNQKSFVSFDMQIDDSGSARTEHEKILIFDFALLFCEATRRRHLGTLIHDGAFEGVNEDTKFQLLNWLYLKQQEDAAFQYIVTINRDSFELLEDAGNFSFDLNNYVRMELTKDKRFLRKKYIQKR